MTTPIGINFYGNANFGPVTSALAALNKSVGDLQKRIQSLNSTRLNQGLGKSIQNIAQPKFNWDMGLKQADDMFKLLQKNKLAAGSYGDTLNNLWSTSKKLAEQQVRIQNSFATGGKNGNWEMYVPAANAVKNLANAQQMLAMTTSIAGEQLGAIGTKVQNWGKNMQWAGRQLMVGFTIPFAAAAAAAAFYTYQIDKQLVRIEKVYDGSQKGLRNMAMETSKAITETMGTSTKDNLDVMAQMAAVGKTGVDLQRSTAEVQRLTTLGEMDRMQSLQAIITLQSTFKMSTEETAEAINYMNAVENATSLSMADFAEALPRAAAPVAELGGSLEELGTIMVAMKERGIEAGEGANAVKTLMTRMLSPTREAQKLFQQLTGKDLEKFVQTTGGKLMPTLAGLADMIKNSNLSLLDQQKLVSELGGAWQSTRLTSILQGLADGGGQVAKAMELARAETSALADKAAQELEKQTQSVSGQFDIALNTFMTQFEEFGKMGIQAATMILQTGKAVMEFFNGLPEGVKTMLSLGAAFIGIAGPLVMIVGLVGNLAGLFMKSIGGMLRWVGGYKSMTVEQKASKLAADQLNKGLMNQADMVQILVFQLEKLQRAYQGVATASAVTIPGGPSLKQDAAGRWQRHNPETGKNMGYASKAEVAAIQPLLQAQAMTTNKIAENTEKSSFAQKAFSQNAMLTTSAITGVGSMVATTGSGLEKWLTTISLVTAGITLLYPVIETLISKLKTAAAASTAIGSGMSGVGKGAASGLLRMGTAAVGAITSPLGIALAAGGLAAFGIYKAVTAESDKQLEKQKALLTTTDGWAKSLGFVKAELGQIRKASGEVEDTMGSLVEKMKKDNAGVVGELRETKGDALMNRVRREIYKLETQGIGPAEIERGMRAALQAAGKTKSEIEKIMKGIKVELDFATTKKDIDKFLQDTRNDIASSMEFEGGYQGKHGVFEPMNVVTERGKQGIQENAKVFYERLTQLDPAQQAYVVSQMSTNWTTMQNEFLKKIKDKNKGLRKNITYQELIDDYTKFSPETGFTASKDTTMSREIANSANAMREFAVAFGNLQGMSEKDVLGLKNFGDLLKYIDVGSMSTTQAVTAYDAAIKKLEESGVSLTAEQKIQIATMYASASGLDAAKLAAGAYSKSQKDLAGSTQDAIAKLNSFVSALNASRGASESFWATKGTGTNGFEMLGADPNAQAQSLTNTIRGIYSGTMGTIYDSFGSQMEDQFNASLDRIQAGYQARKDQIEAEGKNLDKNWDAKMQNFQDDWENRMSGTKKAYEQRRRDIESTADAEVKAIENQIDGIREQEQAEQELDAARDKQFEAEKRRIERLNQLANNNIDYNRALAEGNLDEAARVQNNSSSSMAGWASEDAMLAGQEQADKKKKERDLQVSALEERKKLIAEEKALKLQQIADEEQALNESLNRQQEMERRSLDAQREMEKERLQNRIASLQTEQQNVENAERRKQEMNKRTLEIELATLKSFVPKNETELKEHITRVQTAYSKYGIDLQIEGGEWGQIIGGALQSNVDRARMEMSNDNAWASFGASVAAAITTGAFGMQLSDFFNMLVTGQPPAGWSPTGKGTMSGGKGLQVRHAGGPVGPTGYNSRSGRGGSIKSDEIPTLLQRGEYVVNKNAASKLGSGYLESINSGNHPEGFGIGGGDVGMAGLFGGMVGLMMGQLIEGAFLGTMQQQEEMAKNGWMGNIAQQAGVYGGVNLDKDQLRNANIIANVGKSMGASQRDITIALMTAMQESTLRNLNYGDRDSLGLFQQRPSQGWGTPAQVTDPEYASRKFFNGLFGVSGRDSMPLTLAAQAVQRSAFPYAYAKWQSMAEQLVGSGVGAMSDSGALKGFGIFQRLALQTAGGGGGSGKYQKPVNGVVTSEYGPRDGAWHDGIDIGAGTGTPIYSTDSGTVISAGWNNGGFGNWTLIDHGNGVISGYAHQNSLNVRSGQKVGRGQVIGTVGSTGKSTGPHLHFQMGPGPGKFQNPRNFIPSLATGGDILHDNVLANLHKNEKVLTAPLSEKLERGIDRIDSGGGDTYNIDVTISGGNIGKEDVISGVLEALDRAQATKDKRLGKRK